MREEYLKKCKGMREVVGKYSIDEYFPEEDADMKEKCGFSFSIGKSIKIVVKVLDIKFVEDSHRNFYIVTEVEVVTGSYKGATYILREEHLIGTRFNEVYDDLAVAVTQI